MSSRFDNPDFVRTVLEELPTGIYIVDREQRIRFWNRGAEHIIGHLSQEVVGHIYTEHIVDACDAFGQTLDDDHSPIALTLRDGQPRQIIAHFLHKEGHRVPVAIRCRPIIQSENAIEGAIVLFEEAAESRRDSGETSLYGCLDEVTGIPAHRLTRALLAESMAGMEESHRGFGLLRIRVLGITNFVPGTDRIPSRPSCAPPPTHSATVWTRQIFWGAGVKMNSSPCFPPPIPSPPPRQQSGSGARSQVLKFAGGETVFPSRPSSRTRSRNRATRSRNYSMSSSRPMPRRRAVQSACRPVMFSPLSVEHPPHREDDVLCLRLLGSSSFSVASLPAT